MQCFAPKMLNLAEQEPFQGICESTLPGSVLTEDRNAPVVLGEIQGQFKSRPAEPAYIKLSQPNHRLIVDFWHGIARRHNSISPECCERA